LGSAVVNGGAAVKDRWKKVEPRTYSVQREVSGLDFVNSRQLRKARTLDARRLTLNEPDPAQTVNPKRVFALCAPQGASGSRASRLVAGF